MRSIIVALTIPAVSYAMDEVPSPICDSKPIRNFLAKAQTVDATAKSRNDAFVEELLKIKADLEDGTATTRYMHRHDSDKKGALTQNDSDTTKEFKWRFHPTKKWQVYGQAYGTPGLIASTTTLGKDGPASDLTGLQNKSNHPADSELYSGTELTEKNRYYLDCAGLVREALLHFGGASFNADVMQPVFDTMKSMKKSYNFPKASDFYNFFRKVNGSADKENPGAWEYVSGGKVEENGVPMKWTEYAQHKYQAGDIVAEKYDQSSGSTHTGHIVIALPRDAGLDCDVSEDGKWQIPTIQATSFVPKGEAKGVRFMCWRPEKPLALWNVARLTGTQVLQ